MLFSFTIVVICAVSRYTEPPSDSQIQGLVSHLVRSVYASNEVQDVQMTSVQYESVQESVSGDYQNEAIAAESQIENGSGLETTVKVQSIKGRTFRKRVSNFLSVEDGYSAHLLSVVTVVCITTLIIVFH